MEGYIKSQKIIARRGGIWSLVISWKKKQNGLWPWRLPNGTKPGHTVAVQRQQGRSTWREAVTVSLERQLSVASDHKQAIDCRTRDANSVMNVMSEWFTGNPAYGRQRTATGAQQSGNSALIGREREREAPGLLPLCVCALQEPLARFLDCSLCSLCLPRCGSWWRSSLAPRSTTLIAMQCHIK